MATDPQIKELLRSEMNRFVADFKHLHYVKCDLKAVHRCGTASSTINL